MRVAHEVFGGTVTHVDNSVQSCRVQHRVLVVTGNIVHQERLKDAAVITFPGFLHLRLNRVCRAFQVQF